MSDLPANQSPAGAFLVYQTEDGRTRIDVRLHNQTLWLTQAAIADLFQTTPQNITRHLKAIYEEGELVEEATCKEYLQVRPEEATVSSVGRPFWWRQQNGGSHFRKGSDS